MILNFASHATLEAFADVAQLVEQLIRNSIKNAPILGHFLLKPDQTGSNQIKTCKLLQVQTRSFQIKMIASTCKCFTGEFVTPWTNNI